MTPLPCPFCGGTAELGHVEHPPRVVDDLVTKFYYRCLSCACSGGWGRSETTALKMWNMRENKTVRLVPEEVTGNVVSECCCRQLGTLSLRSGDICRYCERIERVRGRLTRDETLAYEAFLAGHARPVPNEAMCGVHAVVGNLCENEDCRRPLHPQ